jgi:hypothetical protein
MRKILIRLLRRSLLVDEMRKQRTSAFNELTQLIQDNKEYPINYNHYFTDNIQKRRQQKMRAQLQGVLPEPPAPSRCSVGNHYPQYNVGNVLEKVVSAWGQRTTADMGDFSCEEALGHLLSIYKVRLNTSIALLYVCCSCSRILIGPREDICCQCDDPSR